MSLPSQFDWDEPLPILPSDCQTYNTSVVPNNGSTFGSGVNIQIDLPIQDAFLIPDSLVLKMTQALNYNSAAVGAAPRIIYAPGYAPFFNLLTQYNGNQIETLPQYNKNCNDIVNLTFSYA